MVTPVSVPVPVVDALVPDDMVNVVVEIGIGGVVSIGAMVVASVEEESVLVSDPPTQPATRAATNGRGVVRIGAL